jgi:hypothetical protein
MVRLVLTLLRVTPRPARSAAPAVRRARATEEANIHDLRLFFDHAPQAAPREFDWSDKGRWI